jgi:hypothetical protein
LQFAYIKFIKYVNNSTQYAELVNSFRNLENGNVLVNSTLNLKVEVLREIVKKSLQIIASELTLIILEANYHIESEQN